ncbi:MAG: hypothetical protein IKT05_04135 [Fibrobacter sp.]|nr:hypothetical protein [Fibrobacter sp.]
MTAALALTGCGRRFSGKNSLISGLFLLNARKRPFIAQNKHPGAGPGCLLRSNLPFFVKKYGF